MEHFMESILGPKDWGWRLVGASLVPVMTDQEPAPDELLKIIRCNPQAMSKNLYSGKECSCRTNGLKTAAACAGCRGTEYQNCVWSYLKRKKTISKTNLVNNISRLFIVSSVLV